MEPRYVIILDFCIGALNIIRLTDGEVKESGKYDFKLNNCQWMTTENLSVYWYEDGQEVSREQF